MRCKLREIREKHNCRYPNQKFNQETLAKRLGVSQPTIARVEKNEVEPSAFLLMRAAKVFKVRVEDLIDMDYNEVRRLRRTPKRRGRPPKQQKISSAQVQSTIEEMAKSLYTGECFEPTSKAP